MKRERPLGSQLRCLELREKKWQRKFERAKIALGKLDYLIRRCEDKISEQEVAK